jgi:peptidoglycan LD-endopeptidase LytH
MTVSRSHPWFAVLTTGATALAVLGTCGLAAHRFEGTRQAGVSAEDDGLTTPTSLPAGAFLESGVIEHTATGVVARVAPAGHGAVMPVPGIAPTDLQNSFGAPRPDERRHIGIDIGAPRGTPVVAAMDGWVVSLSGGGAGGRGLHLLDRTGRYVFYYAHLDGYAEGLWPGRAVRRAELVGYVGTTGNAGDWPHLHLEVGRITRPGTLQVVPLNPYEFLTGPTGAQ